MSQLVFSLRKNPEEAGPSASEGKLSSESERTHLPVRVRASRQREQLSLFHAFFNRLPAEGVAQLKDGLFSLPMI